jgi:predicted SprT family Zn-dependent metalloprotease
MKIPKSFKLLGAEITVADNPSLLRDRNWNGCADYDTHRIEMVPRCDFYKASNARYEQTFCHELAHFLTYYAGAAINHDLSGKYLHQNEEFVDLLGSLIHQAFSTMEY